MTSPEITGAEALAYGALEAGVQFVTGYPGSPATATVDALLRLADDHVRIEWAINEKAAFDAAFGASLARVRSLLCVKSVGLNVALDSLMVSNLGGGRGGFVILVGDDPGGWGSQNEEDSRLLVTAAEVPLLEPTSAAEARAVMQQAFDLSELYRVPFAVRITRALSLEHTTLTPPPASPASRPPAQFAPEPERYNVLPIRVVELHRQLQATLAEVEAQFEHSELNVEQGLNRRGVIAAGQAYQKLCAVLEESGNPPLHILRLTTLHPLPSQRIIHFLQQVDAALMLEETASYVETSVRSIAQRAGLTLPLYGRDSGHLPGAGELSGHDIVHALMPLLPDRSFPDGSPLVRRMPSRQPLCDDCPYAPALEALLAVMEEHGGRDAFIVTGETGCMVRAQLPPWKIMDLKYGMGSSIGLAAGLARTDIPQRVVALSGDSAFLHSGLAELIDAVQADIDLLVVVLANDITALSGGQPHPATAQDALGRPRRPADLVALIRAAGVECLQVVDPEGGDDIRAAYEAALASDGVSVVIAEHPCPYWADRTSHLSASATKRSGRQ